MKDIAQKYECAQVERPVLPSGTRERSSGRNVHGVGAGADAGGGDAAALDADAAAHAHVGVLRARFMTVGGYRLLASANFGELVLGCIEAKFCK